MRRFRQKHSKYEKMDVVGTNERAINCSCGKRVPKGEGVKISFLHIENQFSIRHKCYCSEKCAPDIFQSGQKINNK